MLEFRFQQSSTTAEFVVRIVHLFIALIILGFSVWAVTYIESTYRFLYVVLMLFGLIPLQISLCGKRKTVFQALFFGYWW